MILSQCMLQLKTSMIRNHHQSECLQHVSKHGKPLLVLLVRWQTEFLEVGCLEKRLALGCLVNPNDPDHAELEFPGREEEELQRDKDQQHDEEQQRGEGQQRGEELHLEVGLDFQEQIHPQEVYASWIV